MSTTTVELKREMKKNLDLLRTLRDEVRVKIHLAGMDAKQEWNEFEPRLGEIERAAHEFTEASKEALEGAVRKLNELRSRLH